MDAGKSGDMVQGVYRQMMVSLIQMSCSNNLERNLKKHITYINKVRSDIIVFPECSLTGYDLQYLKKYHKEKVFSRLQQAFEKFHEISATEDRYIIIGTPYLMKNRLYNCSYIFKPDGSSLLYFKRNLTEEERTVFSEGNRDVILDLNTARISIIICRDQSDPMLFKKLKQHGVDYIIIQSAHFYNPDDVFWKRNKNIAIPIARALDFGINILKVNAVGKLQKRISHGNSMVVDKHGRIIKILDEYNEDIIYYRL